MADKNLDPYTRNKDIGIVITESHLIPQADWNIDFGFMGTIIKAATAGTIVWFNKYTNETGVWTFEAGEGWAIACTHILTGATIDTVVYTTTVPRSDIWVAATANAISNT